MTRSYFLATAFFLLSSSITAEELSQGYPKNNHVTTYTGVETNEVILMADDEVTDKTKQIPTKTANGDKRVTIIDTNGNLKIIQPPTSVTQHKGNESTAPEGTTRLPVPASPPNASPLNASAPNASPLNASAPNASAPAISPAAPVSGMPPVQENNSPH